MTSHFRTAISRFSALAGGATLDLIFPPVCRLCDVGVGRAADFCGRCERALSASEHLMASACRRCGRPGQPTPQASQTPQARQSSDENRVNSPVAGCLQCHRETYPFDHVVALWAYRDRVRDAVVRAKYSHHSPLADALGRHLARRIAHELAGDPPDWITFVPSHFTRQLARGGNGGHTIATAVATCIGRPCRQWLRVTRQIEKQAWLEESLRAKNVRGAFATKKSYALPRSRGISNQQLAGRHILVVDDVLTTGATAGEVSRILREAGAQRVTVAVVARAIS